MSNDEQGAAPRVPMADTTSGVLMVLQTRMERLESDFERHSSLMQRSAEQMANSAIQLATFSTQVKADHNAAERQREQIIERLADNERAIQTIREARAGEDGERRVASWWKDHVGSKVVYAVLVAVVVGAFAYFKQSSAEAARAAAFQAAREVLHQAPDAGR